MATVSNTTIDETPKKRETVRGVLSEKTNEEKRTKEKKEKHEDADKKASGHNMTKQSLSVLAGLQAHDFKPIPVVDKEVDPPSEDDVRGCTCRYIVTYT